MIYKSVVESSLSNISSYLSCENTGCSQNRGVWFCRPLQQIKCLTESLVYLKGIITGRSYSILVMITMAEERTPSSSWWPSKSWIKMFQSQNTSSCSVTAVRSASFVSECHFYYALCCSASCSILQNERIKYGVIIYYGVRRKSCGPARIGVFTIAPNVGDFSPRLPFQSWMRIFSFESKLTCFHLFC